jgi:hypothetical protein
MYLRLGKIKLTEVAHLIKRQSYERLYQMQDSNSRSEEPRLTAEEFDPLNRLEEVSSQLTREEEDGEIGEEEVEEIPFPHLRRTYPVGVTCLLGGMLLAMWLYICHVFTPRPWVVCVGAGIAIGVAMFWRHDSNRTHRDRLPPEGWKSEVEPAILVNLSEEEFDGMRFELSGNNNDDLEDHEPPTASRYSRDIFFWIRSLVVLGCLSPLGAVFLPSFVHGGSGTQLSQEVNLVWVWIALCPLCLITALLLRLHWDYGRLMYDDYALYILRENPAWLPWIPGKRDIIRITNLVDVDGDDEGGWAKHHRHGTVIVQYQEGLGNVKVKRIRRVAKHRDFCDGLNGMMRGGSTGGMY